jgi:hypothetical protein
MTSDGRQPNKLDAECIVTHPSDFSQLDEEGRDGIRYEDIQFDVATGEDGTVTGH